MNGFHIDLNMAQHPVDYIFRWLDRLRESGYDTILWELENKVAWETCPDCVAPDAYTKSEFRTILRRCRELGLESIPLFQTIGHAEYVLKADSRRLLREDPSSTGQYCPQAPAVREFLQAWIREYVELFDSPRYFHLGADEARRLGFCPTCKDYVATHSVGRLYTEQINGLAEFVRAHGARPMIWGDMVLHHPEALDFLAKDIVICDWVYDVYHGYSWIFVWGKSFLTFSTIDNDVLDRFGACLFPDGYEPGRAPNPFYAADYLKARGFDVVTCPASSHGGDNVFAPRNYLHLRNTQGSFSKGREPGFSGSILTSWSLHLHPWELQLPTIELPGYMAAHSGATLEEFQSYFCKKHFGADTPEFWLACGKLANPCLFTTKDTLGFEKEGLPLPRDHARAIIGKTGAKGPEALRTASRRVREYGEAARLFADLAGQVEKGHDLLVLWQLAAENLVNRARISERFLSNQASIVARQALPESERDQCRQLLAELQLLRDHTSELYQTILTPEHVAIAMNYMYGAVEALLVELT
jgi:hypothetical protein